LRRAFRAATELKANEGLLSFRLGATWPNQACSTQADEAETSKQDEKEEAQNERE
jgi:hypothetical protein